MAHAKGFIAALAAAAVLGGTMVTMPTTAQAGASTGTWKYGAPYRGYYGGPRYYGGHHGGNWGAAAAAGAIGGLALGAMAAAPAYGYGYGAPYGAYGAYGGDCYITRQQVIDQWGYAHWRRVRVCD